MATPGTARQLLPAGLAADGTTTRAQAAAQRRTHKGETVLDEDAWTQQIEAIIERDFFPDLPKLQNKLEWLQAVGAADPAALRQAQLNIAQRRMGIRTPIGATPAGGQGGAATSVLRSALLQGTPVGTPAWGQTPGAAGTAAAAPGAGVAAEAQQQLPSLDRFFAKHTSEDNAAFAEIAEASRKRKRAASAWLFEDKGPQSGQQRLEGPKAEPAAALPGPGKEASWQDGAPAAGAAPQPSAAAGGNVAASGASAAGSHAGPAEAAPQQQQQQQQALVQHEGDAALMPPPADRAMVEAPGRPGCSVDGYGSSGQPSQTLDSWPYVHKNALFYDSSQREALPWSEKELAERVQGPPKAIKHAATRFAASEEEQAEEARREQQPTAEGRYEVLSTPAITPGAAGESPFITWGEVAGTPLRLEAEDDIHVPASTGPSFSMPANPQREQLGRSMAQKSQASLKRRAELQSSTPLRAALKGHGSTPKTGIRASTPGQSRTPGGLSVAGRRLARRLHGSGADKSDVQLRASYTGHTPAQHRPDTDRWQMSPSPALPRAGTPVSVNTTGMASASEMQPVPAFASTAGITNDLLQL